MNKIKIFVLVIMTMLFFTVGYTATTQASSPQGTEVSIPAATFTQDKNNKMLLQHNFKYDDGMLTQQDTDVDNGFYITVP